jgi:V8-like Glu-specific endopeptidase
LDLISGENTQDLSVRVLDAAYMPEAVERPYHSWKGETADYKDLYTEYESSNVDQVRRICRFGDRVAMMIGAGPSPEGEASWCCSGLLLSPELFLTNWHCGSAIPTQPQSFWHKSILSNILIDSTWDGNAASTDYQVQGVGALNRELDYVALKVKALSTGGVTAPLGSIRVRDVRAFEKIFIVHHGECKKKLVSQCNVKKVAAKNWINDTKSDFHHDCDTASGSSGAPVFGEDGAIVGIHHLGHESKNGPCDYLNKAISLSVIIADLKQRAPVLAAKISLQMTQPAP